MSLWDEIKHAFAINEHVTPLDEEQKRVLEKVVIEVQRRNLTTPALMFLEMSRPLTNLSAQLMHYFQPIVGTFLDVQDYQLFAGILERKDAAMILIEQLDTMQNTT